ncbi:TPA: helix-turn-helix transcriptional regulator [Pasteurella multocida]|nr:helix-turn-helix transcriptional regulator [Pasteurella multocida]
MNIRGLPENIIEQLQKIAEKNERSLEAEARYLIQQWCFLQNTQQGIQNVSFLSEISKRLYTALNNANQVNVNEMTFSQLAEKMNVSINDINAWFLAKKEIPFFHLDALSQLFGCNAQWLKHGVGAAYNQIVYNIFTQHPLLFAKEFLSTKLDGKLVYKLHVILNEDTGYVYIIQEFKDSNITYTYVSSSFSFKGEYGSSGFDNTARFVLMLLALDKIKTPVIIKGYLIKDKFANPLFNSQEKHPLLFKRDAIVSPWNEGIIDPDYPMSYWSGYKTIQQSIHKHIENDLLLNQYKKDIKQFHGYLE